MTMAHRTPHQMTSLTLSTLLAGASVVALGSPVYAKPSQPFWALPAVLTDATVSSAQSQPQHISLYRPDLRARLDLDRLVTSQLDTQWPALNSLEFKNSNSGDASPTLTTVSSLVALQPAVSTKVNRIAQGLSFNGSVGAQVHSLETTMFNGSFNFSSDVIDEGVSIDNRDFRDPQLRETPRELRARDVTRRQRFASKLIDSGNLKLMVSGELGQISESFARNFNELPTGQLVLPGTWTNLSSRLEFGRANVSVGYQDYETRSEARKREHVALGFSKSELQIYRRQESEFNLINGGQWLKRTSFSGISAELIVADILPDAVADRIEPIIPLLPTSIMGGFERGDVVRAEFTSGPRDKVSTANLAMTWDTRLGETTASFWERRIATDMITPGVEDGMRLSRSSDRYVDLSHSVRRGNWKFGAGLSLIQTNDEVLTNSRSESEVAPHLSIAYEPERGPKVELRFGAADAQSQIVDDNLAARAKTRQLQLSVDVSDYVRESLNRPDAKLKLEYRYDFSNSGGNDTSSIQDRDGGHALLLTFSTPLN